MIVTRILALLSAAIFFGEIAVMIVLDHLHVENAILESVIDATALVLIIFPILYFFALKSMLARQANLETGVKERTAAIEIANGELEKTIENLKRREKEMVRLGEMGSFFQSCEDLREAMVVAEAQLPRLFPHFSGALFLLNSSRNILERCASWGDVTEFPKYFAPPDCWAVRRSKPHAVGGTDLILPCSHMTVATDIWQICMPLIAQGDAVGVLCLVSDDAHFVDVPGESRFDQKQMQFLCAASENVSLAVANLRLQEKLSYQALRDPLTGLLNRRYLFDTLDRELERAASCDQRLSVVMFDIDHFKRLNDTFGHAAGDAVLAKLGAVVKDWTRGGDIAVRYGGEEFTIVLPDTSAADAFERVELLRCLIEDLALEYQGGPLGRVTISGGIATYPIDGANHDDLIRRADEALYKSKKSGRNQVTQASASTHNALGHAV